MFEDIIDSNTVEVICPKCGKVHTVMEWVADLEIPIICKPCYKKRKRNRLVPTGQGIEVVKND